MSLLSFRYTWSEDDVPCDACMRDLFPGGDIGPAAIAIGISLGRFHPSCARSRRCGICRILCSCFLATAPRLFRTADWSMEHIHMRNNDLRGYGLKWEFGRPQDVQNWLTSQQFMLYPTSGDIFQLKVSNALASALEQIVDKGNFRGVSKYAGGKSMWNFLNMHFESCVSSHPECGLLSGIEHMLPRRLLLISTALSSPNKPEIRLVDTSVHNSSERQRYVALSHCWGDQQPIRTTKANINSHTVGIDFDELPATYRDTVIVAKHFAVSYIWIDSLCIIQDDENDWAQESSMMDKVYQNAFFTVIAASSRSCEHAFLGIDAGTRSSKALAQISIQDMYGDSITLQVRECEPIDFASTLLTNRRAWCYQEEVFARRQIRFSTHAVEWRCARSRQCECRGLYTGPHGNEKWDGINIQSSYPKTSNYVIPTWLERLENYTSRDLTMLSDKLPAMSGIASWIARETGWKYYAGVWSANDAFVSEMELNFGIIKQLCWSSGGFCDAVEFKIKQPAPKFEHNRPPSWSWASLDCGVKFGVYYTAMLTASIAKVISLEAWPAAINKFGTVKTGAYIRLKAKRIELTAIYPACEIILNTIRTEDDDILRWEFWPDSKLIPIGASLQTSQEQDATLDVPPYLQRATETHDAAHDSGTCLARVILVFLYAHWLTGSALVMGGPKAADGEYERIGIVHWGPRLRNITMPYVEDVLALLDTVSESECLFV